jgi:ankyrin repeat protein
VALATAWSGLAVAEHTLLSDTLYDAIRTNDLTRIATLVKSAADANAKDPQGITALMHASAVGSPEAVKYLAGKGAEINAQSDSGLTALMLGSTDLSKVQFLLERGANVNARTKLGRSALFIAAMSDHSVGIVRLLLSKGADVTVRDTYGNTMLNAAAAGNDTETVRLMIDAGVDVNAGPNTGLTALMQAAGQSNVQVTKMLLAKGAKVNPVAETPFMNAFPPPKSGPIVVNTYTALLMAAPFGPVELVQALLDAGADINAVEARKMTPLMLAVAADHQDPAVIRLLMARGADTTLKSSVGWTAAEWATRTGAPAGIDLLHAPAPAPQALPDGAGAPLDTKTAIERSVALLEKASRGFYAGTGCVSCHAQAITDIAVAESRARGARVDEKAAAERVDMVKTAGFPAEMLFERTDIRVPEVLAYTLTGFAAASHPPTRLTDAMATSIAAAQTGNGSWHVPLGAQQRPPAEDGDIFRTALCVRSLQVYGPPARAADMQARIAHARQWLQKEPAIGSDDRAFQLLGLYWAGAPPDVLKPLAQAIVAEQRPDGGWRQNDRLFSDAYATGQSLYALTKTGNMAPSDPIYQRGVKFLLDTQRTSDGSWRVQSRALKLQAFFQSGFPYGGDQWISTWATGWATMALAQTLEAPGTGISR